MFAKYLVGKDYSVMGITITDSFTPITEKILNYLGKDNPIFEFKIEEKKTTTKKKTDKAEE